MNRTRRIARKYLYREFLKGGIRIFMERGDIQTASVFRRELDRIDNICRKRG